MIMYLASLAFTGVQVWNGWGNSEVQVKAAMATTQRYAAEQQALTSRKEKLQGELKTTEGQPEKDLINKEISEIDQKSAMEDYKKSIDPVYVSTKRVSGISVAVRIGWAVLIGVSIPIVSLFIAAGLVADVILYAVDQYKLNKCW